MSWTSSLSERPSLLLFEMSKTPSFDSECSPWIPLICTLNFSAIASKDYLFWESLGNFTWTEARIAVPRFEGQEVMYPKCSSCENLTSSSIWCAARLSRSKTAWMSEPCYIEMILSWSSSLTHTKNVFDSLWYIPRPLGQSLLSPQACKNLSPYLKN